MWKKQLNRLNIVDKDTDYRIFFIYGINYYLMNILLLTGGVFMRNKKEDNFKNKVFENVRLIKEEMQVVKNNFDMETDEFLIDSYIYQMEALNKRYQYFIRQAKEKGYKADKYEIKGGKELCSRIQ